MSTNQRALHDTFARHFIGFEPLLNFANRIQDNTFPPHNIEQITADHYQLTLAVAGFSKKDISMTLHDGSLVISGAKTAEKEDSPRTFVYQGIGFRDFQRSFKIGDNVEIIGAKMEHGLLTIDLERQVPETEKPRVIAIK